MPPKGCCERPAAAAPTDDECAICLDDFFNRCVLDGCCHAFCLKVPCVCALCSQIYSPACAVSHRVGPQ